ncbi:hypothetical protein TNIN_444141 [Trichonephila inaurata madagascariensis]|uniref:Uncharacterized protein n=1 Tax=Trichonephila inaurata madagascariensis TaxID=2747483 RepID=A0A8X6XT50_9ARAC|nr:hypothetical protein TNIN_444141 [Trichonephila inaurata madagascariensis]
MQHLFKQNEQFASQFARLSLESISGVSQSSQKSTGQITVVSDGNSGQRSYISMMPGQRSCMSVSRIGISHQGLNDWDDIISLSGISSMSVGSVGDQVNGGRVLVGGSGFVGFDLSSEATVVGDAVDLSADFTGIGETVVSLDCMSVSGLLPLLLIVVVLHAVSESVGLEIMVLYVMYWYV